MGTACRQQVTEAAAVAGSRSAVGMAQRAGTRAWDTEVNTEVTKFTSRQNWALGPFKRAWRSYHSRWGGGAGDSQKSLLLCHSGT